VALSNRKNQRVPVAARPRALIVAHLGVAVTIEVDATRRTVRVPRKSGFVVGDEVLVDRSDRLELVPRRTELLRRAAGGGVHVVAANLDVLFIVAAVDPPARVGLVDRAAVAARSSHIEPILIVNKADLADPEGVIPAMTTRTTEMRVVLASAVNGDGVDEIARILAKGGRGALVGPSGVGKSSLFNRLVPNADLLTRALSAATGAGRHTTATSTLLRLAGGGELIDTPGIREYGLVDVAPPQLAAYFPGFAAIEEACRFRDCLHEEEPACTVKQAVDEGRISMTRYRAYRKLLAELKASG
jgi:ribosome biogenesis GTPase